MFYKYLINNSNLFNLFFIICYFDAKSRFREFIARNSLQAERLLQISDKQAVDNFEISDNGMLSFMRFMLYQWTIKFNYQQAHIYQFQRIKARSLGSIGLKDLKCLQSTILKRTLLKTQSAVPKEQKESI